jgi:hypothetical protein
MAREIAIANGNITGANKAPGMISSGTIGAIVEDGRLVANTPASAITSAAATISKVILTIPP